MGTLPTDGYIPDASRTVAEMKVALEALRDVFAQMIGGGLAKESLTISGGVITPSRGVVEVDTEGAAATDDLVTIQTSNLPDGSLLLLHTAADGRDVVLKHGTGNIILRDSVDRGLFYTADLILLYRDGSSWREIYMFKKGAAEQRSYLGLGTAAIYDTGSGNNLDADKLDGNHASAFLGATAKAADSELLDGVDGANYARLDLSSLQDFVGNIRGSVKVIVNDPTSSTPQFELQDNGTRRGLLFFNGTDLILRLYQSNGTTIAGSLKITDTTIEWSPDAEATWYDILHDGNISSAPVVASNLIAGTPNSGSVSGSCDTEGDVVQITMNRFSFFPSIEVYGRTYEVMAAVNNPPHNDPQNPKFRIRLTSSLPGGAPYYVSWEYID